MCGGIEEKYNMYVFFFFQAEAGIRDWSVTGVQTCALPISCFCFFFIAGFRKEYLFIIRNYCCKNVVYFSIFSIVHSPIIPPLPLLLFCLGAVINAS